MYDTIAHKLFTTFTSSSMCEAMLSSSGIDQCKQLRQSYKTMNNQKAKKIGKEDGRSVAAATGG
jgi:hypothetical protein